MNCRRPRSMIPRKYHKPPPGSVDCDDCNGDGVVSGTCSCGSCEDPPEETCDTCDGLGYVDAPDESEADQ
jgi:DnaJ-class molecular chaperone